MQLVKAARDALLKPLSIISGIVERRHTLPILANILISREKNGLSFLSTDIEIQISVATNLGQEGSEVATTVAARKLLDILRSLPEEEVSLSLVNKKLIIQSGRSRFNLQTLGAEEFPIISQPESYEKTISVPQKTLKHLLNMVYFSMAQQDIRYYLNGLLLVVENRKITAVATDGHRLAFCSVATESDLAEKQEVILPRKTIIELQRLLEESDLPVEISFSDNQVRFIFNEIILVTKLIEGKFPDYQRVIPKNYEKNFLVDREELLRSLQRVAILTTEKFKGVRCLLADNTMKLSSTNADQEEAQEEVEIAYSYEPLDIGFNVNYLQDVLNNLKVEKVLLSYGDVNSSALVSIPAGEANESDFKYVVMPMRI